MNEQKWTQARQGDILIEKITSVPTGAKKTKNHVVALGESQGHGHVLTDGVVMYEDASDPDVFYCEVTGKAAMQHLMVSSGVWTGEHHPIAIEPGIYRVSRQYQYDPYADAIEQVRD